LGIGRRKPAYRSAQHTGSTNAPRGCLDNQPTPLRTPATVFSHGLGQEQTFVSVRLSVGR